MKLKKLLVVLLSAALLASLLAGCASTQTQAEDNTDTHAETAAGGETEQTAPDENYDTGDASLDDPLNQDDIGENELLVVSFGTSYNDNRRLRSAPSRKPCRKHSLTTRYAAALPAKSSLTTSRTAMAK